ncbi:hypothetical protein L1F28_08105 [Arthrospira platensis NCB002]|nr:hypothetical protein [Arthrospira platensis]MDF2208710.1 hypothetical protein [Arthrospira platensis NCB002]
MGFFGLRKRGILEVRSPGVARGLTSSGGENRMVMAGDVKPDII